jgi:hypothetical protein
MRRERNMAKSKVPVSMRAIIQRINRKLKPDDEALKIARGEALRQQVGDYYRLNFRINGITGMDVDPEALARELGVLHDWEQVIG